MMQPAISTLPRIPSCSYPGSSVHFFMIKRFCGPLIKTVQTTQRIRGNSGVAHNRRFCRSFMEESKHWTINEVPCKEYVAGCEVHHKELKYGSVNLHLVQCGNLEGELVLLLHGFPNFWYAWKNQLNMLKSAGYHIIAPDLRGYNASSQPVDIMSYSRRNINADLISLIQYFNLGKPTNIVGHDWGGTVALCFAEDNPDLVRRLVVVNAPHLEQMKNLLMTSPRQLLRSWYMFFIQIPWLPEWCLSLDRFNALRKSLPASFPVEDVDKYVQAWSKPGSLRGGLNYYRAALRGYWAGNQTDSVVDVPVTVIWGVLDEYLGHELAHLPKLKFIKSVILRCPKASHWPMWDDPEDFNSKLLYALNRND